MAILTVYDNFTKRKNSTKRPSGGATVNVKLKENTSLENPVFIVKGLANANYCEYLGNYYFVEDVVFVTNEIVELHCSMDALATNRDAIASYNCFVERAQSQYDEWIRDSYISQKQTGNFTWATPYELPDVYTDSGTYIVRVMGKNGIRGFVVNDVRLKDLLNYANDFNNFPDVLQGLDEIVDGAVRGIFNPDKYIVSVKWFPLKSTNMPLGASSNIGLGSWITTVSAPSLDGEKLEMTHVFTLPTNPYATDFRKLDPTWSRLILKLPCIGVVFLDPTMYNLGVRVKYIVDLITGELTVLLFNGNTSDPIGRYTGIIGVDVQIGLTSINPVSGQASMWGSVLTGDVAGALSKGVESIKSILEPNTTMIGSTGSVAEIQADPYLRLGIFTYDTCHIPNTVGRPLMQNVTLGTLNGYVKCGNASLESTAYGKEKNIINNYLNNGFYME